MTFIMHYIFFISLYFLFFILFYKSITLNKFLLHSIMVIYLLIVLTFTVIPLPNIFNKTNEYFLQSINLIPFRDLYYGYGFAKREAFYNVLMMIPFGFLFPLLSKRNMIHTIFVTFLFSLLIESLQLLTVLFNRIDARTFDVTDLITNSIGGIIGYILFSTSNKFAKSFTKKQ